MHAKFMAPSSVPTDGLAVMTQESVQFRRDAEWHRSKDDHYMRLFGTFKKQSETPDHRLGRAYARIMFGHSTLSSRADSQPENTSLLVPFRLSLGTVASR